MAVRALAEVAAAGYLMPAEWEPHRATYLVWPHNRDTWPDKFEPVPAAFAAIVAGLSRFEPVRLLVKDAQGQAQARAMVQAAGARSDRVEYVALATNDSWVRDYGPIFVRSALKPRQPAALDWRFNSWGGKYGEVALDDAIPRRLSEIYDFEVIDAPLVLEGGAIDVNGAGSLLTTESCLLNPNRNPNLDRAAIQQHLAAYLGTPNVLWLGEGIAGDDTDGHVDDLARFVAPDTIVVVSEADPADPNYAPLRDNLKRLQAMRDQGGRPFRIETLPMPPPLFFQGQRLPASYANFYIANGAVLMPTFDCPTDREAAETLARLFPSRQVLGFPCLDLVWGLGTIHCLSQQHPA